LALFLFSRFANGTLYFYINRSFMAFTLLAVLGLLVVGLSYRFERPAGAADDEHDHTHDHKHHHDHEHDHVGHDHNHGLTWAGAALVMLPVLLAVLVSPQPLGASALANREVNQGVSQNSLPGVIGAATQKATTEMNVLDWWTKFRSVDSANTDRQIIGQQARLVGFVYHDEKYGADNFLLVRYVVSCCVADASALGLVIASDQAAQLADDQWIEVSGTFAPGDLDGWQLPLLVAEQITPVEVPNQPYLYP
jgi:uncharacterized repeat protein (TIGR03943 family)